jgi:hypothetical protein
VAPLCAPAFFWWWFAYDAYARDIFVEGAYISASGAIVSIMVAGTSLPFRFEFLGQSAADLVQDQPHQRLGAAARPSGWRSPPTPLRSSSRA